MNTRCECEMLRGHGPAPDLGLSAGWPKYYLRESIVVCPAKARTSRKSDT